MKSTERRKQMKENNKIQACLDLREGGDEWMRKHVRPPKPSQGHQKEGDQLCVHMSVCGCVCVRAGQQLGVGVNAWMTDQFLLTLPLRYTSIWCKIKENTHLCTHRFWSRRKAEGSSNEIQNLLHILQIGLCQEWHNCEDFSPSSQP